MLFDDVTMKENMYGVAGALENESKDKRAFDEFCL